MATITITPEMKAKAAEILERYGIKSGAYDLGHDLLQQVLSLSQSLRSQAGVSEAVAWQHKFELPDGHSDIEVNTCPDHPFGRAGRDYDGSAVITSTPLFSRPAPIEITEELVERLARELAADDLSVGGDTKAVRDSVTNSVWPNYARQARRYLTAALQGETK